MVVYGNKLFLGWSTLGHTGLLCITNVKARWALWAFGASRQTFRGHINVNAAISNNSSKASASAVARDFSAMFVGASVVVTEGISDPKIMEAVACRESLALASDLLLQKIRVACDNITVVRNI